MKKPELYKSWEYNGVFDIEEDESKLLVSSNTSKGLEVLSAIDNDSGRSIRHTILFNLITNRIINLTKDNALKHIESIQHNCLNYVYAFIEPKIINDDARKKYIDYTISVVSGLVNMWEYSLMIKELSNINMSNIDAINSALPKEKVKEFIERISVIYCDIIVSMTTISSDIKSTPESVKKLFIIEENISDKEVKKLIEVFIRMILGLSSILISLLSVDDE